MIGSLLTLVLLGVSQWVPRYRASGPELLENPHFAKNLDGWRVSQDAGICANPEADICIENSSHEKAVFLSQQFDWPASQRYLILSADLQGEKIEPGERSWHFGRLVLARYDYKNRWLNLPHYVAALAGSSSWETYATTFSYDSRTTQSRVLLQLPHATGRLSVRNLSLKAAFPNPFFSPGQVLAFILGGGWLYLVFRPHLSAVRHLLLRCGLLLVLGGILLGTLVPGTVNKEITGQTQRLVDKISHKQDSAIEQSDEKGDFNHWSIDIDKAKAIHFSGFLLLGLILSKVLQGWGMPLLDGLLLAVTTELLQLFVFGRTALFTDVLVDMAGVAVGCGLWLLYRKVRT